MCEWLYALWLTKASLSAFGTDKNNTRSKPQETSPVFDGFKQCQLLFWNGHSSNLCCNAHMEYEIMWKSVIFCWVIVCLKEKYFSFLNTSNNPNNNPPKNYVFVHTFPCEFGNACDTTRAGHVLKAVSGSTHGWNAHWIDACVCKGFAFLL